MQISEYIAAIDRDGALFADAAEAAGPDAPVPSCPEWVVRDLVGHQGFVHRWAAANLRRNRDDFMSEEETSEAVGPTPDDDKERLDWFREGVGILTGTLAAAPDDVVAFTFMPAPTARHFWARRQAHETAIHRIDAQLAAQSVTPFPPDHAADGLDELLCGFGPRSRKVASDPPRTLAVRCTDIDAQWRVQLGPERLTVVEADAGADCTVSGEANDLYLLMWNRGTIGGIEISGEGELLDFWQQNLRVRWG